MSLVKNKIKRTTISHDVIAKSMEKISNQSMLQEKWGTTRSLHAAHLFQHFLAVVRLRREKCKISRFMET